jgi:YggT family protein
MNAFFVQAGSYIIQAVFGLFVLAVLLRFLFQIMRADFYNPVSQFVVALTNPILRPLRRLIPGLFGIDVASLLLMLALKMTELFLVAALLGQTPTVVGLLIVAIAELLIATLYVFIVAILVRVVLSWLAPYGGHHNPVMGLLVRLTDPVLRPAQRLIPPIGGIDLSPIVVLIALRVGVMLVHYLLLGVPG